jgi:probable addiction module antidote protein
MKTKEFDEAAFLKTDEDIAAYITEALATGDPALITYVLGVIGRTHGMTRIARETGLSRESLYRALSAEGNPEFVTVLKIMEALGLRLTAERVPAE